MQTPSQDGVSEIRQLLREFAAARDWDQFHTPKNLAIAISIEAAELLELFQWDLTQESELTETRRLRAQEEIADVFVYLVRFADRLGIDLIDASRRKIAANALRYPVELAKGSSKKHDEF